MAKTPVSDPASAPEPAVAPEPEPAADPVPVAVADTPPVESTPETLPAEGDTPVRTGKPNLGVIVHQLGDGTSSIHGIEPDGTEHQIVMPTNHGALLSFNELMKDWFGRLGDRATTWKKQPAEPIPEAEPSPETPPAPAA
jgi:hypothetical protein